MKNINCKEILEFLKTPRGKAIAFFAFYLVFFLILMIAVRSGGNTASSYTTETDSKKPYNISFEKILDNNYHFKYEINLDQNTYVYEGNKNGNKELFTLGVDNFYRKEENFLKNTNGIWLKNDNPYIMNDFLDINKITNIFDSATYISKTDYESGMKVYNFQITTNTLVKLLENIDIDIADIPNEIIVKTDEENSANEIKLDLSSYCKYKNLSSIKGEITLNYDNFGEIEEINDPS